MIRTLNVLALAAVIGSATAAYSVKYETILIAEKLRKRESELARERDAITVLKAEWQLLNRPARLAALTPPEPGMGPVAARQIVRVEDVPQAKPGDKLSSALDGLLTGALPPPDKSRRATTPASGVANLSPRSVPKPVSARPATPASPRPDAARASATPKAAPKTPASSAPMMLRPPANVGAAGRPPAQQASAPTRASDPISRLLGLGSKPQPAKPVDENRR